MNSESDQFGCELAWLSFTQRTDVIYFMWSGMIQGVYCGKDFRKACIQQGDKRLNQKKIHPTEKPIPVYKYILNTYLKTGDKILDTHGGSLSLAIACHDYGFELTACELDCDYYNDAAKRLKEHIKIPIIRFPEAIEVEQTKLEL